MLNRMYPEKEFQVFLLWAFPPVNGIIMLHRCVWFYNITLTCQQWFTDSCTCSSYNNFFPPRNERRNETLMIVSVTKFARPQKNQNERIWKKNCKNQNHLAYMRHTSKKYFVRRKTDSISKGKKEIGFI